MHSTGIIEIKIFAAFSVVLDIMDTCLICSAVIVDVSIWKINCLMYVCRG